MRLVLFWHFCFGCNEVCVWWPNHIQPLSQANFCNGEHWLAYAGEDHVSTGAHHTAISPQRGVHFIVQFGCQLCVPATLLRLPLAIAEAPVVSLYLFWATAPSSCLRTHDTDTAYPRHRGRMHRINLGSDHILDKGVGQRVVRYSPPPPRKIRTTPGVFLLMGGGRGRVVQIGVFFGGGGLSTKGRFFL